MPNRMNQNRVGDMHLKVTKAGKTALHHMAERGSAYDPSPNQAIELVALGFTASNGLGSVRITTAGRKFLRDIEARLQF